MKTPMVANLVANGLNIALDPVFIFGWGVIPPWGVSGAAWATILSWGVAAIGLLIHSRKALRAVNWRPSRALMAEVIQMGLPLGAQRILGVLGFCCSRSYLDGVVRSIWPLTFS